MVPEVFESGPDALAEIIKGDPFDLALLDYKMPVMDGRELAMKLREFRTEKELPLVLLSSVGGILDESVSRYFKEVLSKPIKPAALHTSLLSVIDYRPRQVFPESINKKSIPCGRDHRV